VTSTHGRWRDHRERTGGMTWRPYPTPGSVIPFDAADASTWRSVASVWGGDVHMDSRTRSDALYLQDEIPLGTRWTFTPGVRAGRWSGNIRPFCGTPLVLPGCRFFEAVRATAWDPRIGVAWDVTGHADMAAKAHVGRYHQALHSLFFDRVRGANVYGNQRLYYTAPVLSSSTTTFTASQRDATGSGFSTEFSESIANTSGPVERYRQPYVDQALVALEKSFGRGWKAEVAWVRRRNGDVVGLRDRNLATNYSPISDVHVEHRFVRGGVLDPKGNRLVLPAVYVPNYAIQDALRELQGRRQFPATIFGYDTADVWRMTWEPDVVLTTIPEARRSYDHISVMVRAVKPRWRGEGSLTAARLKGNIAGVNGYGTSGTRFSAGPFVNPNEAVNGFGYLPNSSELEGKAWFIARLPHSLSGGLVYTHALGERFAPTFEMNGQYTFFDAAGAAFPTALFESQYGQTMLTEPRGARHYASRAMLDAHLEWTARHATVTLDLFNTLGENALVSVKTELEYQAPSDPSTWFGAPRLRVAPRTLRVGIRVD
jgi:hypothetical protein